jgi:hypothetical protein
MAILQRIAAYHAFIEPPLPSLPLNIASLALRTFALEIITLSPLVIPVTVRLECSAVAHGILNPWKSCEGGLELTA